MGRPVIQETRRWDDNKESSRAMRSKEDAKDYRYFPDPDLPPVHISDEWIQRIRNTQPQLREEKQQRYQDEMGLSDYDARVLTESAHLADLFEKTDRTQSESQKDSSMVYGGSSSPDKRIRYRTGKGLFFAETPCTADLYGRGKEGQPCQCKKGI